MNRFVEIITLPALSQRFRLQPRNAANIVSILMASRLCLGGGRSVFYSRALVAPSDRGRSGNPGAVQGMKARGFFFLAVVVAALLPAVVVVSKRSPLYQAFIGNWDFVKSASRDTGTYYRLKVKLTYKGEPQEFDIVVGCDVRQTNYMDGGRTVEVGITPSVFGRRMSDGKGLVVRPPEACRGQTTENNGLPPDLLPLVIVYDDAETLAFGTAYLTDDAYESPLSVLQFGGATIERADRSAFQKFRSEQPNLVKRSSFLTPQGLAALKPYGLPAARIPMGILCYGYARFRLAGYAKQRVRQLWPIEHPRYWRPLTDEKPEVIDPHTKGASILTDQEGAAPVPADLVLLQLDSAVVDRGMPRRHPTPWGNAARPVAPSYYPDIGGWIALPWPADAAARGEALLRDGPHVEASIDFRNGATRGFAYCWPLPPNFPTGIEYPDPFKAPSTAYFRWPATNLVDGIEVVNPSSGGARPPVIAERDEFVFRQFHIWLPTFKGDV
jgi:hypothetical protein